jgi:hypothetical protein
MVVVVTCAFPATGTASINTAAKAASTDPVNRDLLIIINPRFQKNARSNITDVTKRHRSNNSVPESAKVMPQRTIGMCLSNESNAAKKGTQ